jgi:hypothetical protein
VELTNGVFGWSMSPSKYICDAVCNVIEYLSKNGQQQLPTQCSAPWLHEYISELDETPELLPELANYYQLLIGILHWMVEISQVDMITEVSKLASHMAMPRKGHLQAMLHIFGYLKKKHGLRMVFDPSYPDINHTMFKECDWQEFYGDVKEAMLANTPTPLGKEVDL